MSPNRKISAVIFDCDGVMFDSRQANTNFYNHLLAHFNLSPMKEDDIAYVHMHTAEQSVRHIFRETPHEAAAQQYRLSVDYNLFIKDMIMEPGLKETLTVLKPRFGLAVATNRSNTIATVLESNGLDSYFDIVVSSLDVKHPKPHPESLHKILAFFGIEPWESLYVGDSIVDYETARSAGVPLVAYKNRTLNADYHLDRLVDMVDLLKEDASYLI